VFGGTGISGIVEGSQWDHCWGQLGSWRHNHYPKVDVFIVYMCRLHLSMVGCLARHSCSMFLDGLNIFLNMNSWWRVWISFTCIPGVCGCALIF
jgi:hypothetical protein